MWVLRRQAFAVMVGVLAWLVRGCLDWQRDGLQPPKAVQACTDEWRDDSNDVKAFVNEVCAIGEHCSATSNDLYAEYREWAKRQGNEAITSNAFGRRLTDLGYPPHNSGTARMRKGIGLYADVRHRDRENANGA